MGKMMMNHWDFFLCDVFRQTYLDAVASNNLTENYGWHWGKHQNRPEIRCQNQNPLRSPGKEKSESEI
jgi:hypothetical protein